MSKDVPVFLTPAQAVQAVCKDFQQYAPQLMLFSEILPIITDNQYHLKREPHRNGAWINTGAHGRMRWIEGPDLVEHMCDAMASATLTIDKLATICARVFQSRVTTGTSKGSDQVGLYIETGMAGFQCRQCGRCCRTLDYHNEITPEDVQRWRDLGRKEILDWVGVNKVKGQPTYRIWIHPASGKLASPCPFLKVHSSSNRVSCRIHESKPAICRSYPMSRKHGLMTGCPGFKKTKTNA